jgi:hypothetical protein
MFAQEVDESRLLVRREGGPKNMIDGISVAGLLESDEHVHWYVVNNLKPSFQDGARLVPSESFSEPEYSSVSNRNRVALGVGLSTNDTSVCFIR